jgi:CheY-like chemotaxis protein
MTVLLVDDVIDARDMYALYFRHVGIKVITASDGHSALRTVRIERPDIVVLDLAMPGVTGWDVIREVKADPATREIPILVLSGQRAQEGALRAGAAGYCEKPCLPDKLFSEVMRVLYGR